MIGGAQIGVEHILDPARDRATHQHQRVDRKERIWREFRDVMTANKALRFQRLIFGLVLDAAERVERRHVVGRLVDPPEQHRDVFELHAGTFFNGRNGDFSQIGIGAAEIELELDFHATYHRTSPLRQVLSLNGRTMARPPHAAILETYSSKIELSILTAFLPLLCALRTQMGGCFLVSAYLECSTGS